MRRTTSSTGWSLKAAGARRSELSMVSETSAWLREARPAAPAKITSSMPPARMALAELAPITQRSASRRFDLPQPFGPTMPVTPGSIRNSVGSTKDLKPERRSRWKCTALAPPALGLGLGSRALCRRARLGDGGIQVGQRHLALQFRPVDEEGGGG